MTAPNRHSTGSSKRSAPAATDSDSLPWPADLRPTKIRREWHRRLASLPPGLSLREMSQKLGASYASVAFWVKKLGVAYVPQRRGRKSTVNWDKVDWSLRNSQIARAIGVSGERVRQIRLARNLPPTPRLSGGAVRFQNFLRRHHRRLHKWSLREMLAESGAKISIGTAHSILKRYRDGDVAG